MKRNASGIRIFLLYFYLFLVWAIYHYFTRNPGWVDEMVVKPVVQLVPVLFVAFSVEKKDWQWLGFTKMNVFLYALMGTGVGVGLLLIRLVVKQFVVGNLLVNPHGLSGMGFVLAFLTSTTVGFVEETMFRGYFFQQLRGIFRNELAAMGLSSVLFMGNHIFYVVAISHYTAGQLVFYIGQLLLMGMLFAWLFAKTRSLTPSIVAHTIWNFSNALFL